MTHFESPEALPRLLDSLAIEKGEVIYVCSDLAKIPLPQISSDLSPYAIRAREDRWCEFVFQSLIEKIGPSGTLLVPTFSYKCSSPSIAFSPKETPSEVGPFSNWLRRHPNAIRSLHPIFSVTGVGKDASLILNDCGKAAFGPSSPFGRLEEFRGRFVSLGVALHHSLTYAHHLEQLAGCGHRINKNFFTAVKTDGKVPDGPFWAFVRNPEVPHSVDL